MKTFFKLMGVYIVIIFIRYVILNFYWGVNFDWQILLCALILLFYLVIDTIKWANQKSLELIGYYPQWFWHWVFKKINGYK